MSIVKIHKNNKNLVNGEGTYDEIINRLIDEVEDYLPIHEVDYSTVTSIKLKENTVDRLESYKLTEGESLENVIVRMIILSQQLNNSDD